ASGNVVTALVQNESGGYESFIYDVGAAPTWVVTADLDADGRPDIATANYGSSNVTVLGNANTVVTGVALTSAHDPAVPNEQVPLSATVNPFASGGSVSFFDGGTPIGGCTSKPLDASRRATCAVAYASGTHTITARYSGG